MNTLPMSLEALIRSSSQALVIGVGGGGDVVGALASARFLEFCGLRFHLGGLSWERFVYDPVPGPRSLGEIENTRVLHPRAWMVNGNTRTHYGVRFTETEMAALYGATDSETYGGAEVRGASTIRYHLHVDLERAAEAVVSGGGPAVLAAELRAAAAEGAPRFPADVWIDGRGRVRRLQIPVDPTATVTTVSADNVPFGVITVDLFDFGVPAALRDPGVGG